MIFLRLCQLAAWIGRHTAHWAWDVVCGISMALVALGVLILAVIILPSNREA